MILIALVIINILILLCVFPLARDSRIRHNQYKRLVKLKSELESIQLRHIFDSNADEADPEITEVIKFSIDIGEFSTSERILSSMENTLKFSSDTATYNLRKNKK